MMHEMLCINAYHEVMYDTLIGWNCHVQEARKSTRAGTGDDRRCPCFPGDGRRLGDGRRRLAAIVVGHWILGKNRHDRRAMFFLGDDRRR